MHHDPFFLLICIIGLIGILAALFYKQDAAPTQPDPDEPGTILLDLTRVWFPAGHQLIVATVNTNYLHSLFLGIVSPFIFLPRNALKLIWRAICVVWKAFVEIVCAFAVLICHPFILVYYGVTGRLAAYNIPKDVTLKTLGGEGVEKTTI